MSTVDIEDFDLSAGGRRLAARWLRPGAGPHAGHVIVFLHEGLGCIGMWQDFPARVVERTGLAALVYDRYGHGGSDPVAGSRPDDWMQGEAYDVLPDVLDHCGIVRPILFGHSDGGTIALLYAARHETTALVTEAAHIFDDALTQNGLDKVAGQWGNGTLFRFLQDFHGDRTNALVRAWLSHWRRKQATGWAIDAVLPSIACPVLAIQGDRDEYGTREQLETIAARVAGPSNGLLVADCGHIPHLERSELILTETADFLGDLPVQDKRPGPPSP